MLFQKITKCGLSALIAGTTLTGLSYSATAETAISTSNSEPLIAQSNAQNNPSTLSIDPDLNGKWHLQWRAGGVQHRGILLMNGKRGKLYVDTNVTEQPIKQTMELQRDGNGFMLQGFNPTHRHYSPDKFYFQLGNSPSEISNVQNCSGNSCFPVNMNKVRNW